MNDERRGKLRKALGLLVEAYNIVDGVKDKEEDCYSNYPENLQSTDVYYAMEDAIDYLGDAGEAIETAIEKVKDAIGK